MNFLSKTNPNSQDTTCKTDPDVRECFGRQTLKAPFTTAADDIHKYFFIVFQRN